jgi:hypothetical protein
MCIQHVEKKKDRLMSSTVLDSRTREKREWKSGGWRKGQCPVGVRLSPLSVVIKEFRNKVWVFKRC